ncbi:MAG TPA: DUF1801 domain-containing protein [Polyangiaceae bacterium]|nr:DUF1801 domain-containing protein [Polyangiaceae bacterium]
MATKKTKRPKGTGEVDVDAFVAASKHPLKREIDAVRAVIRGADKRIHESIKWNAPSYSVGEHFATFHLRRPDAVMIVFHTGAKKRTRATKVVIDDSSHLLTWLAKDRATVALSDMTEIRAKRRALTALVKQWIDAL